MVIHAPGRRHRGLGPLEQGGGHRFVDGMRIPALDASLETLADEVRVDPAEDGEVLAIRIGRRP